MLYDKRWEKPEVKTADPFSLDSLIAWLEKQPADVPYCYHNTGGCLLHQYFTAHNYPLQSVAGTYVRLHGDGKVQLSRAFRDIASGERGLAHEHTFGAALERARKIASTHSS